MSVFKNHMRVSAIKTDPIPPVDCVSAPCTMYIIDLERSSKKNLKKIETKSWELSRSGSAKG